MGYDRGFGAYNTTDRGLFDYETGICDLKKGRNDFYRGR